MFVNKLVKSETPYIIPKNDPTYINLSVIQNYNIHVEGVDNSVSNYPMLGDNYELLLKEILEYNNLLYTKNIDNILLTNGSGFGLNLILKTFSDTETKILIPFPNYPGFVHDAELTSTNVKKYKYFGEEAEYEDLLKEIEDHDIIYLSTPNIPIGYELKEDFNKVIQNNPNKLFIIDEAYFEYGTNDSFINITYENLIITRTFSKAFGLAGARLGYIISNKKNIDYLKVIYCTKSVTDYSINLGLKVMQNKEYYLNNVNEDKIMWNKFFKKLDKYINKNETIYEYQYSGFAPFFIIYTKTPIYVCDLFFNNGILIRDKSNDLKKSGLRITLSTKEIMNKVLYIIKKINGYSSYDIIYLDIDKTIRKDYKSLPYEGISKKLQLLKNHSKIKLITNSIVNYEELSKYLKDNNIYFDELITIHKKYIITNIEYKNGYFIRDNLFYLLKYPIINYDLYNFILEYKVINIIEDDIYESSLELGYDKDIKIPFIGKFKKLIKEDIQFKDIEFKLIGKQTLEIEYDEDLNIIMIGDSEDDYKFAKKNNIYFKRITEYNNLNNILMDIINS